MFLLLESCEEKTDLNSNCENLILLENLRPGSASESWLPSPQQTFVQYQSSGKVGTIQYEGVIDREYQYSQTDLIQCKEDSSKIQSVKYDVYSYQIKGKLESDILKGKLIFQLHVLNDRKKPLENNRLEYLEIKFENSFDSTHIQNHLLVSIPTLNKDYPFQVESPPFFPSINIGHRNFENVYYNLIPELDSLEFYYSKTQKIVAFKNKHGTYTLL
ncbi:MAG: hypothetical protein IPH93_17615 [Saprospiraceae bacterium]|nr:hypothetical protein [Saprospiraceae bacterium]MBK7809754.1 hypothetical protein [Saprospiraceae bacterium]MBK9632135.1 hypothetical protein [Saprospiraceae bacterium]